MNLRYCNSHLLLMLTGISVALSFPAVSVLFAVIQWKSVYLVTVKPTFFAVVVLTLIVYASFIKGAPTSTPDETDRKDLKRDIDLAKEITTYTTRAINTSFLTYCERVPIWFTSDCNYFMAMLNARSDIPPPKVVIDNKLDFQDVKSIKTAVANMSRTVSEYLGLVKQHLDVEYKIVCEPAIKIKVGCHFPKFCSTLPDNDFAILYCNLNAAYHYLDNLKVILELPLSDSELANVNVDSQVVVPQNLSFLYRRWHVMLMLHTSLNQVNSIQQKLTEISKALL